MSGSGFFKGEKKKQKKGKDAKITYQSSSLGAPTFKLPELISKKKKYG